MWYRLALLCAALAPIVAALDFEVGQKLRGRLESYRVFVSSTCAARALTDTYKVPPATTELTLTKSCTQGGSTIQWSIKLVMPAELPPSEFVGNDQTGYYVESTPALATHAEGSVSLTSSSGDPVRAVAGLTVPTSDNPPMGTCVDLNQSPSFRGTTSLYFSQSNCGRRQRQVYATWGDVPNPRMSIDTYFGAAIAGQTFLSVEIDTFYEITALDVVNPFAPKQPTDSRFINDKASGCTKRSTGSLKFPVKIDRVVGATVSGGKLDKPSDVVVNDVIAAKVKLRLPMLRKQLTTSSAAIKSKYLFNGKSIDLTPATGPPGVWTMHEADIPTEDVRFGTRVSGQAPTPGENEIEVQVDKDGPAGDNWCEAIGWAELSFKALYPIVMVHGNSQGDDGKGGDFWKGSVLGDKNERLQMASTFIEPFEKAGAPIDYSISLKTQLIDQNGDALGELIPKIAAEFGVKHVHLVAHSKGGLNSRSFLARKVPKNLAVLSLTTLSTPHNGSAGPDYQIDSVGASAVHSDDRTRTVIGIESPPNPGTWDLRVSKVAEFNAVNKAGLPKSFTVDGETTPMVYRSISADANLDSSANSGGQPTISWNETEGLPGQGGKPNRLWATLVEQIYRLLGNVASTRTETISVGISTIRPDLWESPEMVDVKVVRENPTASFEMNDVAVTVKSATIDPFVPLSPATSRCSPVPCFNGNHSTVANAERGQAVFDEIRKIQPVK